ncbi:MAG: succinate dehydrogenase, cytochrome b556 subunit, partial [Gammaproteobacteria bacterium]|nr:succinate dehydrogenase, cytochrome b556 subunit [Gammaproteobacteria bacterium]
MPLRQRPLSPHLQVYRPQLTSVLSILHRMTGIVLSAGLLMMSGWVVALALGEYTFDFWNRVIGSALGQFVLAVWVLSLYYHLAN